MKKDDQAPKETNPVDEAFLKLVAKASEDEKVAHDQKLAISGLHSVLVQTGWPIFQTLLARLPWWALLLLSEKTLDRFVSRAGFVASTFSRVHAVAFTRTQRMAAEHGACECDRCKKERGEL